MAAKSTNKKVLLTHLGIIQNLACKQGKQHASHGLHKGKKR